MLITGEQLKRIAQQMSEDTLHVGTSSIDVRLGFEFYIGGKDAFITRTGDYHGFEHKSYVMGQRILFKPGYLYIAHSLEYVRMPNDVGAILLMRSTAGRRGLDHLHAGWLEPGWEGQITFELSPIVPTEFEVGERIAQLVLVRAEEESQYAGHYQGQKGATLAKALLRAP